MKTKYNIISNPRGRKILVLEDITYIEQEADLKQEDFEAMFINMDDPIYEVNRLAIWKASPILFAKTWLKPCYVSNRLKGKLHLSEDLRDGYANDPQDIIMTNEIEEIYQRIQSYGFKREGIDIYSTRYFFIYICQLALSRGKNRFTDTFIKNLSQGISRIYMGFFEYSGRLHEEEFHYFLNKMLELHYIREIRFVEKVYLCPHCQNSHLLFLECCPQCGTSNIKEESVLHHFRCANVSPESTYSFDGELRCPKCKQELRHIGVDYDRPAQIYTCNMCSEMFLRPTMKVVCTHCKNHWKTSELTAHDIKEFEFTSQGIKALSNGEIFNVIGEDLVAGNAIN